MKKLLLSLGAIASVAAPVAAVVACGSTTSALSENGKKSLEGYKTQANALPAGAVKTAALAALDKIKSDQDLANFAQSQAGKDLMDAALAGNAGTTGTGSSTGTGVPAATNTVKTEQSTLTADKLAATTADQLDNLVDVRINLGIRLSGQVGTTGWTFDATTLTLTHTTKNGDQEQKTVFNVLPKAVATVKNEMSTLLETMKIVKVDATGNSEGTELTTTGDLEAISGLKLIAKKDSPSGDSTRYFFEKDDAAKTALEKLAGKSFTEAANYDQSTYALTDEQEAKVGFILDVFNGTRVAGTAGNPETLDATKNFRLDKGDSTTKWLAAFSIIDATGSTKVVASFQAK